MNAIRSYRWAIIVFAWLMLAASFPAPAARTSIYVLDYMPVLMLLLGAAVALGGGQVSDGMAPLLMGGFFLFVLSPLFLIFRAPRWADIPFRLLSLILLCPW